MILFVLGKHTIILKFRKRLKTDLVSYLIGPVPIWTLSVGHNLPHDNAETPDIGSGSEFSECDGFRCCPSHRDLAAPGRVGSVHVGVGDLARQTEVGNLAD